jgi:hypothetical protein
LALALEQFRQTYQRPWPDDRDLVGDAFIKAATEHGPEAILASAARWVAAVEPRYLPEPVKWLEGLWRRDPPPKRP